jgi:tetratricopeptide (TPR) repeat protein
MKRSVLLTGVAICASLQLAGAESVGQAQLYAERYAAGNYSEAAESAKLLVSEILASGADDLVYADALQKLADAQKMMGDLDAAIENYRSAVGRIESAADMLSRGLIEPLAGLADALAQKQQYAPALKTYERAAHISHVNEGPMNLQQSEILTALIDLYAEQEMFKEAVGMQAYQLRIYRRAMAETDPRVIGAWRRNGELLGLSGEHQQAQELYTFAADIIRVADGQNSLAQIDLLNDLSESYLNFGQAGLFTRIEMARAELERVVLITESNADASLQQRVDAYVRMGDFMQRYGEWKSALRNYRLAWMQMTDDELMISKTFAEPVILNPPEEVMADYLQQYAALVVDISVAFDVNRRGEAENVIVQGDPSTDIAAKRALALTRKLVFRPKFEAGEPVHTADMIRNIPVVAQDQY